MAVSSTTVELLTAAVDSIGAVEDAAGVEVEVELHSLVGAAVAGDLDDRHKGEADRRAAAGW